jgi:hypothetical protein
MAFPSVVHVSVVHLATMASLVKSARPGKKHPRVRTPPLVLPAILVSTKTSPATPLVLNAPRDTPKTKTRNLFVCLASPGKSAMPTEQPVQNVCRECTKVHKRKLRAIIAVPGQSCPSQVLPNAWIAFLGNFKTKRGNNSAKIVLRANIV